MARDLDNLFLLSEPLIDEESISVASLVRQWADREIISKRMEYRENYSSLFLEKRRMLSLDIGLDKLIIPSELGGFGWNSLTHAPGMLAALIETARADAATGVLSACLYALLSLCAMEHGRHDKLCDTLSSLITDGKSITPAIILTGPGTIEKQHPLFKGRAIIPEITPSKGSYIVTGSNLRPVFAGSSAELFCVICADKDGRSCIAYIPGDAKGIKRHSPKLSTGLNACENADVSFNDVRIPKDNIIDRDGAVEELYIWLNLLLGGVSAGASINFFEILSDWSDTRIIKGGTTLKENPLCASVLADVAEETSLAVLLLHELSGIIARPQAMDKTYISRTFTFAEMIGSKVQQGVLRAINRGMELMGSSGYAKEWHVEKHWRDVKTIGSLLCGVGAEAPVKMDTARYFYNCKEL